MNILQGTVRHSFGLYCLVSALSTGIGMNMKLFIQVGDRGNINWKNKKFLDNIIHEINLQQNWDKNLLSVWIL